MAEVTTLKDWPQRRDPGTAVECGRPSTGGDQKPNVGEQNDSGLTSMRTRNHDTLPDPAPAPERVTPTVADSDRRRPSPSTDAGGSREAERPISDSEAERMDQVLRSLAKRRVMVPNSLEPGTSYHGEHAPAPARGTHPVEPATLLDIPTDPLSSESRGRTTAAGQRGRAIGGRTRWILVGLGALLVITVIVGAIRALQTGPMAPASAAHDESAPAVGSRAAPPVREPSLVVPSAEARPADIHSEGTSSPRSPLEMPSGRTSVRSPDPARAPGPGVPDLAPASPSRRSAASAPKSEGSGRVHPATGGSASPSAPGNLPSASPSATSSAKPMPLFELLEETR